MPPSARVTPGKSKEGRRGQILDAAAELFATHGFHGVGIDDIGAAVGITGPALYRHFRGKDAMLGEMLISISEILLAGGLARAQAQPDPATALRDLVAWQVDFALDNRALITVHTRDLGNLADPERRQVRALQRRYVEVWAQTIRKSAAELGSSMDEPTARAAAHAAFGLINSTPHSADLDRGQMAALLRRMTLAALTAPGS
jgi:AcrR family transcriptional regulator